MAQSFADRINVDIKSVKDLRAAIREYQDSLVGVNAESEEFKNTTENLRAAQDELNKVTRAGKDAMDAASDSIVGMERQYKDLYNQYKLLTEEQRNSDFGKNMAESLNQLSNKLNETKQGVGNFKDNIGRYTSSIMDAFQQMGGSVGGLVGPFKTATQGVQAFNATLKANPVGAVITLIMALVNVIKQLSGSIKDNEESQMRLNQAMASFQPIIDGVKNAFDKVGQAIVSIVEFLGKAIDKIREAKAAFTDFLGITKGAKEQIKEQQKIYQDLAKSVNELTLKKREYQKANAEDKAEVERLREEASETENLQEKKRLLEEAKAKQAEIDQRNIEIAKEELRILQVQDDLTANSAEDNEKLAAAVAKVAEAEATAAANMRQYNKQLNSTDKGLKGASAGVKNWRDDLKKSIEEVEEYFKTDTQKLKEKFEEDLKLWKKAGKDTTQLSKKYNDELNKIVTEKYSKMFSALKTVNDREASSWSSYEELYERLNGRAAALNSQITKLEGATTTRIKKIQDVFNELFGQAYDTNNSGLMAALDKLWDYGDLSNATDLQELIDTITAKMMEMSDVTKESAQTAIDYLKNIGSEGWGELVKPLQYAVLKLEELDGISVKTGLDTSIQLENVKIKVKDINKELQELAGEESFKRIQQRVTTMTEGLYSTAFNMLKNNDYKQVFEETTKFMSDLEYEQLAQQKAIYEEEIENFKGTQEQRVEILQAYYDVVATMREKDLEKEQQALDLKAAQLDNISKIVENFNTSFTASTNGVISLANGYKTLYNAQIQEGKLNEKETKAKKKRMQDLEKVVLAATIAQIVASTAQGLVNTWVGFVNETSIVNPQSAGGNAGMLGILNAASLAAAIGKSVGLTATAAGQIAAARGGYISNVTNLQSEGSAGSAAASVATPTEPDYVPFQYTRQVQSFEEEEQLNRPLWISVQDINSVQERVKVVEEESSF